ncbi:imidazole glycerol phosphate synthase [Streptomyces regensis]|nr:imidazole glycerol phosphate synthase [Streptomyces regensis]
MPSVVILDYGSGNLRSAERAVQRAGADVEVTADPHAAVEADGLVVPGVGAFGACAEGLRSVQGDRIIGKRLAGGRPVLGICVGMQILFERGVEHGVDPEERFYFVHSYAARDWSMRSELDGQQPLVTWAHHGEDFVAAVENGALCATQFHPEKSGDAGAQLLRNWLGTL